MILPICLLLIVGVAHSIKGPPQPPLRSGGFLSSRALGLGVDKETKGQDKRFITREDVQDRAQARADASSGARSSRSRLHGEYESSVKVGGMLFV
jgi:hypothetical protein